MRQKYILTLFLLSSTFMLFGQDSNVITETCEKIRNLKNKESIESQVEILSKQIQKHDLSSQTVANGENPKQEIYRYNYKFVRELNRSCSECIIPITVLKDYLFDIEGVLSKNEIDSLEYTLRNISREKHIYSQIITVDDFYPYSSIADFATHYRTVWAENTNFYNGTILIVLSQTLRQVRISTSEKAMTFLENDECTEVNNIMTPYFKQGRYFQGLIEGIKELKKKL